MQYWWSTGTKEKNQKQPHTSMSKQFDKGTEAIKRRKNSLSISGAKTIGNLQAKNKLLPKPHTKINFKGSYI